MKKIILTMALMASVGLSGCQTLNNLELNKENLGAASGAVLGGVLGSKVGDGSGQLWATGVGVLVGGLIGSEIGRSLDRADLNYLNNANTRAHSAPLGETISWNNPQSGNYGTVTPKRDGQSSDGSYCREYQQTIYVGGRQETAVGTACKQADGTWRIVS